MQKFPSILDLKQRSYDFYKMKIKNEINIENDISLIGHMPRPMAILKILGELNKTRRFGQNNEMFWLASMGEQQHAYVNRTKNLGNFKED